MRKADIIVFAALLFSGTLLGTDYVRAARKSTEAPLMPGLNQRIFGAALMSVCGRENTTPVVPMQPEAGTPEGQRRLIDFLVGRRETFTCRDIPTDVPTSVLDAMQRKSRYLLLLATGAWRLMGLSWGAIDRLLGTMFGISVALAYLVCRLGMPPGIGATIATLFMLSPLHLTNVPDLRDYSKAPFFVATLLVVGLLVTRRRPRSAIVGLACASGAMLGLGFGMRTDAALNMVLVLAALAVFLPERLRTSWKTRGVAIVVCVASFLLVAFPVLRSDADGSGSLVWHWAILGYGHDFNDGLGVSRTPYEAGYFYSDSYVATVVDAFWAKQTGTARLTAYGTRPYEDATRAYYSRILAMFPADALLRGWAAIIRILDLPYSDAQQLPHGLLPGWVDRMVAARNHLLAFLSGFGVILFLVIVVAVSGTNLRLALLLFWVVTFLGAYPAIQFQRRHIFQLELVPLWVFGFALSCTWAFVARAVRDRFFSAWPPDDWVKRTFRPAVFGASILCIVVIPLAPLRAHQQRTAIALLEGYERADVVPIHASPEPIGRGLVRLLSGADMFQRPRGMRSTFSEMIVAEISADRCPVDRTALTFRYITDAPDGDFTRTFDIAIPTGGELSRLYFPVYETGATNPDPKLLAFGGIEVVESEQGCVKRLSRFSNPDSFPLLLSAELEGNWRQQRLYEALEGWEGSSWRRARPVSYWAPMGLRNRGAVLLASVATPWSLDPAGVDYIARIAHLGDKRPLSVNGNADGSGSYLIAWKELPLQASDVVRVDGTLEYGGVTVGLTEASQWANRTDVDAPGAFRVFVQAPRSGRFQLVIANHLNDRSLRNRLEISRIALVDVKHE